MKRPERERVALKRVDDPFDQLLLEKRSTNDFFAKFMGKHAIDYMAIHLLVCCLEFVPFGPV